MPHIKYTTSFKKDVKLCKKRGLNIEKLKSIIVALELNQALPSKNKDHHLIGNWAGCRECHIEADWLLIYRKLGDIVELARTGSHSDLFNK